MNEINKIRNMAKGQCFQVKDDFYNKILQKKEDNDTIISNKNNNLFF